MLSARAGSTGPAPPIWLLDVDGVLNAVTLRADRSVWPRWRTGTARADGRSYPITFAPDLMAGIRELHDRGSVDIRWLTTWGHDANRELRRLLDLPEFPVVGVPSHADVWWKLPLAQQVAREQRPLIWTDDDLARSASALEWLDRLAQPALAIGPRPDVGLRPEHLDGIARFIDEHAGR